jgi:hypothetical protein
LGLLDKSRARWSAVAAVWGEERVGNRSSHQRHLDAALSLAHTKIPRDFRHCDNSKSSDGDRSGYFIPRDQHHSGPVGSRQGASWNSQRDIRWGPPRHGVYQRGQRLSHLHHQRLGLGLLPVRLPRPRLEPAVAVVVLLVSRFPPLHDGQRKRVSLEGTG